MQVLQIGEYQVLNVFQQLIDGKMVDCAEAYYKQETTNNFKSNTVIIKTGALYNAASIGPKEIKNDELIYGVLLIEELKLITDPSGLQKSKGCVVWKFISSSPFEAIKDLHSEFEMDLIIQHQEQESELQNIADGILFDELESGNLLEATRIGNQTQTEQEMEDHDF